MDKINYPFILVISIKFLSFNQPKFVVFCGQYIQSFTEDLLAYC